MGKRGELSVGWCGGHQRPHPGLRVRMATVFAQQGVGTIVKVIDTGLTQPSCKVRWDGGKTATYHSGATVSRNALARVAHPEPAQMELRDWIRMQGWDVDMLASCTLGDLVDIDEHGSWKMDCEGLRALVGRGAAQQQLLELRKFAITTLEAEHGLRLDILRAGKTLLTDLLEIDDRNGSYKIGIEEMREALEGPSSDKEIKKQLDELRFFAQRMQSQHKDNLKEIRVSTSGAGHDLTYQKVRGQPGLSLPLVCATRCAVSVMNPAEGARFVPGGGARAIQLSSRGDRDRLRVYPFTTEKLCCIYTSRHGRPGQLCAFKRLQEEVTRNLAELEGLQSAYLSLK